MRILGLMSTRKVSCAESCTAEAAAILLSGIASGILPVVNADSEVIGVVTERSLCKSVLSAGLDPALTLVVECLDDAPAVCHSHEDVHNVLRKTAQAHARGAVVVNESNELVGVISLSALAIYMATAAQELYGALQKHRKSVPATGAA